MTATAPPPPYSLLAELTHRCPLHCAYCSNPLELRTRDGELTTAEWTTVLDQAAGLGVVQVHLSGGEPLMRADLAEIVAHAAGLGVYTNLITSGLGLRRSRAEELAAAGLDSVQLSVQAADEAGSARIAGRETVQDKERAARTILAAGLPLSMNVVLHRFNLDDLAEIIDLCVSWGADRLELANAQYYGWALANRAALLPSPDQLFRARAVFEQRRVALDGRMELLWIIPDYFEGYPKPCMGGWASTGLTVDPAGNAYPCPTASTITSLAFPSVKAESLGWIWRSSPAFNAFRGEDWMADPCRSCDRRSQDFGGCRCQAFALTGDAARTDPVCHLSTDRHLIDEALRESDPVGVGSGMAAEAVRLELRRDPRPSTR